MIKMAHSCRVCRVELDEENWYPSSRKDNSFICKECNTKWARLWRKAHPEKSKISHTKANRKIGLRPYNENKECGMYLGVHIAERVLNDVFKDFKQMPMHNPGYDVICNHEKLIDIKSSCQRKGGDWMFSIKRNTIADYFLCLAFDNRKDLNPLHAWLLPGSKVNHLKSIGISPNTLHKWDAYALDISKISDCCDAMR